MKQILYALLLLAVSFSCQWHQDKIYRVQGLSASVVPLDSLIRPDSVADAYISPFRDSVLVQMNREIGWSDTTLVAGLPESLLSNFVADLMLVESRAMAGTQGLPLPDVAVVNVKGLRSGLPQGRITVANIFQLMPFENEVVLVELSGDAMLQLFCHMASMGGDGMGGATFTIRNGVVENPSVGGSPLDPMKKYCVATSDYLANGGDRYQVFSQSPAIKLGITLRDMIMMHVESLSKENKTIRAIKDGRIRNEQ